MRVSPLIYVERATAGDARLDYTKQRPDTRDKPPAIPQTLDVYTTRVLPPAEWPRLAGTDLETVWQNLDPTNAYVWVVEDGERIIATVAGLRYVVMECAWIAPEFRGRAGVTRRLLWGMYAIARRFGAKRMMTLPANDTVQAMVEKLGGVRLPRVFVVPVGASVGDRHGA